jgi:hypothetical protein
MHEIMGGWMDGWMDGWRDRWMDIYLTEGEIIYGSSVWYPYWD